MGRGSPVVRDQHNELRVSVVDTGSSAEIRCGLPGVQRWGRLQVRVPTQPGIGNSSSPDELTEFQLADDAKAWWIPSIGEAGSLGNAVRLVAGKCDRQHSDASYEGNP